MCDGGSYGISESGCATSRSAGGGIGDGIDSGGNSVGVGAAANRAVLGSKKSSMDVIIEDGVAKTPDRQSFAGSIATTDRLVRTMVRLAEVPLREAVRMMTLTPAAIMGFKSKGALAEGMDADIILFDDDINVKTVLVGGRIMR